MSTKGDNASLHHEAARKLIADTATRLGVTERQVFEQASSTIGLQTYFSFMDTGTIPFWLEDWCLEVLLKPRKRAENLLGGVQSLKDVCPASAFPRAGIMGLSAQDMHDLDAD